MSSVVLDASAILAVLRREPGEHVVRPHLPGGRLSTVNLVEVLAKSRDLGIDPELTMRTLMALGIKLVSFDPEQAQLTASLRQSTRDFGISLADRACIALGILMQRPILTADSAWTKMPLDVEVRLIR